MEEVYGSPTVAGELPPAAAPEPTPPDPALVNGVRTALGDLGKHLEARAAQHPALVEHFHEVRGIVGALAKRFEESALGASVVGHVSETEARLVSGLVSKVSGGRDHLELGYLTELADNLTFAVLKLLAG